MNASMTHRSPAAHPVRQVAGLDRIRGRSHGQLADAMEFLAWYAPGIFTAVLEPSATHCYPPAAFLPVRPVLDSG